jgi:hypothetical protein
VSPLASVWEPVMTLTDPHPRAKLYR